MKSKDAGSTYLVSRAVEEPLEATVELGEDVKKIAQRALMPLNLGILAFLLIIIFLIPSIIDMILYVRAGLLGDEAFTSPRLLNLLISAVAVIFLVGIIITSFLYLSQIAKFISINLLKCCKISDLTDAKPPAKTKLSKKKIHGKHFTNPIFAVMDLEEESMHVIPQIVKMFRFCVFFISISLIIVILTFVMKFGIDYELLFSFNLLQMGLGIAVIIILVAMLKLLMEAESNFRYIHARHLIIDSVRFEKAIDIPSGEDQLSRLIRYLKDNDPYLRSSMIAGKQKFSRDVKLKGASGKEHGFEGYFSGVNILKERSLALGMPMGRFGVFIRIFRDEITLTKIKKLRDSAVDVCSKENMFPLRIIALQWSIGDLLDDVYEYVLESPVLTKNTLTHLEIIAEDGEVYSFIPMISYGEKSD